MQSDGTNASIYFDIEIEYSKFLYSLGGNKITSKGAAILFNTLKQNKCRVFTLYLCRNQLDDTCMGSLGEYLKTNPPLVHISLINNCITDKGVGVLSTYLGSNDTLRFCGLAGNENITDSSLPNLVNILQKSRIDDFFLVNTSLSNYEMLEINQISSLPLEEREEFIYSLAKSAAKTS